MTPVPPQKGLPTLFCGHWHKFRHFNQSAAAPFLVQAHLSDWIYHLIFQPVLWGVLKDMISARRFLQRAATIASALLLLATCSFAAEKQRIRVDDYDIHAELLPKSHKLTARAKVKYTALDDISVATFE